MIYANTLTLALKWLEEPQIVKSVSFGVNLFFTGFFVLEAIIKILGFGL